MAVSKTMAGVGDVKSADFLRGLHFAASDLQVC